MGAIAKQSSHPVVCALGVRSEDCFIDTGDTGDFVAVAGDAAFVAGERDIRAAHDCGRSLKQGEIDRFHTFGVRPLALASPWPVLFDLVAFGKDGLFEFARDVGDAGTEAAFVIGVIGANGLIDLAAWEPRTDRLALWQGHGFALGERQIWSPSVDDEPLPVWRTPLGWLRAGRRGIVILRPEAAWLHLADVPALVAEDAAHGVELEALLQPPAPATKILVRRPKNRRAA